MSDNCVIEDIPHQCSGDETCPELVKRYSKLVYCDDYRCVWNVAIKFKKYVLHHKDEKPFEEDSAKGVCGRKEILLTPKEINTLQRKYKLATCSVRSDKGISGHLDFSRFPQGGNIPDPVDPGAAFT